MRALLFLLVGLFSAAMATQFIRDGSFEAVPKSCERVKNADCGGWRVAYRARFDENLGQGTTPYGEKYVAFFNRGQGRRGTVSQDISGLNVGSTYSLRYGHHNFFNYAGCTLTVTLGSQTVDTLSIAPGRFGTPRPFKLRKTTFVPSVSSGTLTFKNDCAGEDGYEIDLDYISLTGPV